MNELIDSINNLYDVPESNQAAVLQDILIRASAACGNGDSENAHLVKGYAAYHFPTLTQGAISVEDELNAVLCTKPGDTTARFYLACHFFDVGNFKKAYHHFSLLDCSQFRESGQIWRAIKVDELRLCCEAAMEMYDSFCSGLSQLVDKVVSADRGNIPSPTELVCCFESHGKRLLEVLGAAQYHECLSFLQSYIEGAGMMDVFGERMKLIRAVENEYNK